MHSENPSVIFLFSGKRKSGKDYIAERLQQRLETCGSVIIRLSGPIKHEYASTHNLDEKELLSSSHYKEKYRKDMIEWSEKIRHQDHGYFILAALKMYKASAFPIWIVSDMRRRSDLRWFEDNFPRKLHSVRIAASEEARAERGYVFTPGVDDAATECDLDAYSSWSVSYWNEGSEDHAVALEKFLEELSRIGRGKSP